MGLDSVLSDLESEGYTCQPFVIPAVAVDAKHRRDRVWIVGYSGSPSRREHAAGRELVGRQLLPAPERTEDADRFTSPSEGCRETGTDSERPQERTGSGALADPMCINVERDWSSGEPVPRIRQPDFQAQRGQQAFRKWGRWPTEPELGRVAPRLPGDVDRLKQLGNSVVPQIPEAIGRAIMETL